MNEPHTRTILSNSYEKELLYAESNKQEKNSNSKILQLYLH